MPFGFWGYGQPLTARERREWEEIRRAIERCFAKLRAAGVPEAGQSSPD